MKKSQSCRLLIWSILLIVSVFSVACLPLGKDYEIEVEQGVLVGKQYHHVTEFKGIPFATPPTGGNRFAPPQPPHPWQGKKNAQRYGASCIQGGAPSEVMSNTSEDCLFLNVWTPNEPGPHPVMVWIHGGGMLIGSANGMQYDGAVLAESQQVVVVTINYRLSFLGFLRLPEIEGATPHNIVGNQGYLDQLAALQWINQNIAQFGGDENNVTVFGQSGGAHSSCELLSSPLSDGLLHKAILQSGTCKTIEYQTALEAEQQGMDLLERVNCIEEEDPVSCLLALSAKEIQDSLGGLPDLTKNILEYGSWPFNPSPIIDGEFLTAAPEEMLAASSKQADVAMLIGINKDEGSLLTGSIPFSGTKDNYETFIHDFFGEERDSDGILQRYPFVDYERPGEAMSQLIADSGFYCPLRLTADIWSEKHSVYAYEFTQAITSPVYQLIAATWGPYAAAMGTLHGGEINYVFGYDSLIGMVTNEGQMLAQQNVMNYWGNFARTGNPNGEDLPYWAEYNSESPYLVKLSSQVVPELEFDRGHCDFWDVIH